MASELRVVVGEDDVLFRAGVCRVLEDAGIEVVAQTGDADDLLRRALAHRPDVTLIDVQMPPRNEDDGLRAALELRRQRPESHKFSSCRSTRTSSTRWTWLGTSRPASAIC